MLLEDVVAPRLVVLCVGGGRYVFHGSGELDCSPSDTGHWPVLGYGGRMIVLGVTWPLLWVMGIVIGEMGMMGMGVKASPPLRPGPT